MFTFVLILPWLSRTVPCASQLKSTAGVAVVGSRAAFETYNKDAPEGAELEVIDPFAQE